ncbi:MAG: sterol desaturase family protein [Candidatus Sericytochromatia bacterium]
MNLFAGSFLLILLMMIELLIFKFIKKEIPWREVVYNLSSGHILMWILRAFEVLIFNFLYQNFSLRLFDSWSFIGQWVFTFFAWDFCFYWLHRMHHKIPLFWKVHVIHHEGVHFGLSLGLRNSWYSSLSSIPFFIGLAMIGVPTAVFVSVGAVHYFVQFYNHNGIVQKSGFLENFMVTPALHRVHHGQNLEYIDKNCGGTLNIWDRLFGTYQPELDHIEIKYGVADYIRSDNPFWANNLPFMKALHMKLPNFDKKNNYFSVPDLYIATGGLNLLNLWLFYIHCEGKNLGIQQFWLFLLIFLGTIALGALSDNRLWGMIAWLFICFIPTALFVYSFNISHPFVLFLFILFIIHGLYGLKYFGNSKSKQALSSST